MEAFISAVSCCGIGQGLALTNLRSGDLRGRMEMIYSVVS